MKKQLVRNIAAISAIFIVTFTIMLVTNYFQVKGVSPLQTEVVETLKQLNDQNANNAELQEQIRKIDLIARKAYFVQLDHLMMGLYILLGMVVVFVVCLRIYFKNYKDIPDKEIDPIDEWAIKSKARSYLIGAAVTLSVIGVAFTVLSRPYLFSSTAGEEEIVAEELVAQAEESIPAEEEEPLLAATEPAEEATTSTTEEAAPVVAEATTEETKAEEVVIEAPKPTNTAHNNFRGPNSNGVSFAKNVPTKWDLAANQNILWKKDIPRKGYNSPVINGHRVFFTGADESVRELYCYDLMTGDQVWSLAAKGIAGSPAQVPNTTDDTGLAASTVSTNGEQVVAVFATGDILCADMEGNLLWAKNLGVPDNHYGYASSLLIYGSSVFVQYDNENSPKVVALDVKTGAQRWSKSRSEKATWSSPIIANVGGVRQLVLMGNPNIIAYNPNNGQELWSVNCLSGEVGSSAASSNGIIFGASEYSKMVAINGTDGTVLWESNDLLPEVSSPVATKDNVYIATSYGMIAAFDTQTGELRKELELGGEFYSSPVIAEGKLFIVSNSGKMHILSANNDLTLINSFETGEKSFATPAITDGMIVMRTENSIYCVATK